MKLMRYNIKHPISGNRLLAIGAEDFLQSLRENSPSELFSKIDLVLDSLAHVPPLPPSALPFLEDDESVPERESLAELSASQILHPHEELLQTFRKQAKLLREVEDEVDIRMYLTYYNFISNQKVQNVI